LVEVFGLELLPPPPPPPLLPPLPFEAPLFLVGAFLNLKPPPVDLCAEVTFKAKDLFYFLEIDEIGSGSYDKF